MRRAIIHDSPSLKAMKPSTARLITVTYDISWYTIIYQRMRNCVSTCKYPNYSSRLPRTTATIRLLHDMPCISALFWLTCWPEAYFSIGLCLAHTCAQGVHLSLYRHPPCMSLFSVVHARARSSVARASQDSQHKHLDGFETVQVAQVLGTTQASTGFDHRWDLGDSCIQIIEALLSTAFLSCYIYIYIG